MHVYYSSYWAPSKASYQRLEWFLYDFLWASSSNHYGFHSVAWEFFCLLKESGGLGLLSTHKQGLSLCTKWIIGAITEDEAWKILVQHCISSKFLINRPAWKGIGFEPFSLCENPCTYMAFLLSRAYGKLQKLSSLGFTGLVMSSLMGSLWSSRTFGSLVYFLLRVFL